LKPATPHSKISTHLPFAEAKARQADNHSLDLLSLKDIKNRFSRVEEGYTVVGDGRK
jgi:hypothetical protein